MSLFEELKRRNVLRIGLAYLAASWLLIQVADTIFPAYDLPESALTSLITILGIGFVPALVLAWIFQFTTDGLKRDRDIDRSISMPVDSSRILDRSIMLVLALGIAYFAFDKFILDPARDSEEITAKLQQAYGDKSIAVLPFINISSDPEQDYFADGISEELLNLLARIEGLRVISRTSSFNFKDSDESAVEIARKLGVAHILEGSIRRSGDEIRITAQLIDARADAHLWSDTYDRSLNNIFAIQDEVAEHVVEQLKIQLSVGLAPVARHNTEAYTLYLQARQISNGPMPQSLDRAQRLLQRALELDPEYSDAKVELAFLYSELAQRAYHDGQFELEDKHMEAQDRLLQEVAASDPDNIQLNIARGWNHMPDPAAAAPFIERALNQDPQNSRALNTAVVLLTRTWRNTAATQIAEYLVSRDPLFSHSQWNLQRAYLNGRQFDLLEKDSRTTIELEPERYGPRWHLGTALLLKAIPEPEAALEAYQSIAQNDIYSSSYRLQGLAVALHALERYEESAAAITELIEIDSAVADERSRRPVMIAFAYAGIGDADNAFLYLKRARDTTPGQLRVLADNPFYDNLREDPRWIPFLESTGLGPRQLSEVKFNPRLPAEVQAALAASGP